MSEQRPAPLLKPWLTSAATETGMTFGYGVRAASFEGAGAGQALAQFAAALDGTRSVDELVDAFGGEAARPVVEQTLELLRARGVLTEPPADPAALERAPAAVLIAAIAGAGNAEAQQLAARLGAAHARVLGGSPVAGLLARYLEDGGVGHVSVGGIDDADWGEPRALVLAAPLPAELPALVEVNARAVREGRAWLPVTPFDGALAAIGPVVQPGASACLECVLLRREANSRQPDAMRALLRAPARHPSSGIVDAMIASVAGWLVLHHLGDTGEVTPGRLWEVALEPLPQVRMHSVYRVPRCPTCATGGVGIAPMAWGAAR